MRWFNWVGALTILACAAGPANGQTRSYNPGYIPPPVYTTPSPVPYYDPIIRSPSPEVPVVPYPSPRSQHTIICTPIGASVVCM